MTALHRRSGPDLDHRAPLSPWQRERMRGPILPMQHASRPFWRRILGL